ncbi:DUOX-like protein [Mya arenaria]|uniref:DUOX-like protein n=1 Tax=Mya arenaria TaxID=6604 RepID=A0ABY7DT43_MYAAR|nr:DUOX-like protein [Mya arenaria]
MAILDVSFLVVSDGHLLRKSPVAYSDGVYMPSGKDRPNPFEISKEGHWGPGGLGSLRNRTAFLVYFGSLPRHFHVAFLATDT